MLAMKLPPTFKASVPCQKLRNTYGLSDLGSDGCWKCGMVNDVFEGVLRVGRNETYCRGGWFVEGVRQRDLSRLEALFIDNVLLGGDYKPYGLSLV